jgi:iron complex transport system substrate-binding protein
VWVLPYENGGYGKLDKLPYTLVECVEYMENSPLGAAEWMRFYGRLLGCASAADSLFSVVETGYLSLRDSISHCDNRPTLMCELKSSSAWYMPAGQSTMGQLYKDAGADYLFDSNRGSGSDPLAFESVLSRASNADFWLIKYAGDEKRYSTLKNEYAGYVHFKPYRERNIYVCNLSHKRFYAETPFRPDILLRELVAIFHPQYMNQIELRYYEKMEE